MSSQQYSDDDALERNEKRGTRKVFRSRKMIAAIIGIGVALVVLVVVLALLMRGGSSTAKFYMKDRDVYDTLLDDDTLYFFGGKKVDSRVDAETIEDKMSSMDGKNLCFTVLEDEDVMLYLLSDETVLFITENPGQYRIAESGATVAYLSDEDELYLYRTNKRSAEKLDTDVEDILALSPDGKSVAYCGYDDVTYVCSGGKVRELGEDVTVISVSNDASYIYAYEKNEDGIVCLNLYNMKGFVGTIGENFVGGDCYTNADHTQLIFRLKSGSRNKWYAVEKKECADERHTLSSADYLTPVINENTQEQWSGTLCTVGVGSLKDLPYISGSSEETVAKLVYLNEEWGLSTLATKVAPESVQADRKGTTIYYIKNDELSCIAVSADAESKLLASEVESFRLGTDGTVYYLDEFDTLCSVKKGGEPKEIFDEVEKFYVTHDGTLLFVSDESLYTVKKDKASVVVEDFMEGSGLVVSVDCTYYFIEDDGEWVLYVATEGVKFSKAGVLAEE